MLHRSTKPSLFGPPKAPPKPPKPLARKPMKRSRAGLSTAQKEAYEVVDAASNGCCFTCKQWAPLDHSHLFPQGMNKPLRAVPANLVLECRRCHDMWSDRLTEYALKYPEALADKVQRMQAVNRQRWAFWMMKNQHLLRLNP